MKILPSSVGNIYSGDLNDGLTELLASHHPSQLFIIADKNTAMYCAPKVEILCTGAKMIICEDGEKNKNLDSCQRIWGQLIEWKADRNSFVLNVGGGMICDMGGFAASCFQRGIKFANIPTSVLAMADAAIGGKVGIDYNHLKNYIGLIREPSFIWIDIDFLKTLPETEIRSGLAEIVKHAIIGSPQLWNLLTGVKDLDQVPWSEMLELNSPVKVKIVENDLTEQGNRKVLNFGHTIGHALESFYLSNNLAVTHGQCVAIGMIVESKIAFATGLLNEIDFEAIMSLMNRLFPVPSIPLPEFKFIRPWLEKDKKNTDSRIMYSLPDRIGSCRWNIQVAEPVAEDCFEWWRTQVKSVPFRLSVEK